MQPYTVTVATARQPIQRTDGGTEAAEPDVETSSKVVPGRGLMENAAEYVWPIAHAEDLVAG